jgi:polyisoprenyl-teichoic acid--peptidoglycan teichoic acid transferase
VAKNDHMKRSKAGRLEVGTPRKSKSDSLLGKKPDGAYTRKHTKNYRYSGKNEIRHVNPASRSMETSHEYTHRRTQGDFTQYRIRQQRIRKRILIIAGIIAALGIAFFVAVLVFNGAVSSKLHSGIDTNLEAALVTPSSSTSPYYMVVVGVDSQAQDTANGVAGILLVRVDPSNKLMTLVSIPRDTRIKQSSGYTKLNSIYGTGGASALVSAVATFAGVDVAHYIEVDYDTLPKMIDSLGGIQVTVPDSFYDSEYSAGLDGGTQTLDGTETLLFCRSRKPFAEGDYACAEHQRLVFTAVIDALLSKTDQSLKLSLDSIAACVSTDLTVDEIMTFAHTLQGKDYNQLIYSGVVPGDVTTVSGTSYAITDTDEWTAYMLRVDSGLPPDASVAAALAAGTDPLAATSIDPTLYSVDVRNGAGVAGCATEAADILKKAGYNVTTVANASSFVYDETLIVYADASDKAAAKAAAHTLGCGRVIASTGAYVFSTKLLVIVGGDWIPRN